MNQDMHKEQDELTWQAFRYVAGELSIAEVEQFEELLAVDQGAREAVAQLVELYQAVIAAEESAPVIACVSVAARPNYKWTHNLAWLASGAAAAAILIVAGWKAGWLDADLNANRTVASVSPALADAWTAMQADLAQAEDESGSEETSRPMSLDDEELAFSTEAPSWMTAAVLGLSGREVAPPQEN